MSQTGRDTEVYDRSDLVPRLTFHIKPGNSGTFWNLGCVDLLSDMLIYSNSERNITLRRGSKLRRERVVTS